MEYSASYDITAKEVGTLGITVNAICPGLILTDIVNETGAPALLGTPPA